MFNFKTFFSSPEGKIFLLGMVLFLVYIVSIVTTYIFYADDANPLVVMSVTNFFFGRAAGISYGYTTELSDIVILLMNMLVEFIMVLIIYPLFVLSWNKSVNIELLKNFFTNVKIQREKYKDYFEKYGKYGLFLFVWFPFWMTGPIIGALIGFLMGIKHYTTIFIVLSGTSLAIVIWTYFLKEVMLVLNQLSQNAPYIVVALIIIVAIVIKLLKSKKD